MNNRTKEIIDWTLSDIAMYYRDSNLRQEVIDKYSLKTIFRSKTFVDVTNLKNKPTTNCRFLIASSKAAPLYKINPDTEKWGLHTINCNSYFKVLDVYSKENVMQIFLLHIPAKGIDYFAQEIVELEDKLIHEARNNLVQSADLHILPSLQEQEWINRTYFPIGLDKRNEFFSLDITEPLIPAAIPVYEAIKKLTNDLTNLNEGTIKTGFKEKTLPSKKKKKGLLSKLFGKKKNKDKEERTFSTAMMDESKLKNLKVGDTITLGGVENKEVKKYNPVWIEADANQFKRRIFDCREYAINMVTSTKNQDIVSKFLASRKNDGKEYIGQFPVNGVKCEVDLSFDTKGKQLPDGILFKASRMEEKWDIYKYANFMFYVRSWTGELVYFTNYIPTNKGFRVDLVVLDDNKIHEEDSSFEFKVVEFLIYSYVLGYVVPHPLPKKLEDSPDEILGFSYSMFGNRGYFGSYD